MSILVTQNAPDFTASAVMPDNTFGEVTLSDYRGKYVILFFYPMDFTFVCPTEIIAFSEANEKFAELNTQLLGCSTDSQFSHFAWTNTPRNQGGLGGLNYPLLSDFDKKIADLYGILLPGGMALRGLFLIDKQGVVRHELINDLPLGRSVEEALRMVEALQFYETNGEVCPANWHPGADGMKPDLKNAQAYFKKTY